MANITENNVWEPGIYQLETDDPTLGGPPGFNAGIPVTGHANAQAQQLANRTKYIKEVEIPNQIAVHNASNEAHPELSAFITYEADRAEVAASAAAASGQIYPSTVEGLAATVDGQYFNTLSPEDTEYVILYQNVLGSAVEVKRYPSSQVIDEINTKLPVFYESIDPEIASALLLTTSGKILAELPDKRVDTLLATSVTSGFYETIDPSSSGVLILSSTGKKIASIGDDSARISALEAEVDLARGSRNTLNERLSSGLTEYGDNLGATLNVDYMAESHYRLYRIKSGISDQLVITLIGDSYIDGTAYWVENFAKQLQTEFGNAGAGFVGFGWWSASSGTWTIGSQPIGIAGPTRRDVVSICQIIGTWSSTYNTPSTAAPALYRINSSEPGAYVRFTVPSNHNAARLFYSGDGTGVVQVSWDDGATWSSNILLTSVPSGYIDLTGVPSVTSIARIKVVSGNVGLCGVDLRSSSQGVRVSRLGGSGSQTSQWSNVNATDWGSQLAAFDSNAIGVLLGTNDQIFSVNPQTTKTRMETIISNIKSACPIADVWQITPAENANTPKTYLMTEYAKELRKIAVDGGHGYVDLQKSFGDPSDNAAQYKAGSLRPLLDLDNVHPSSRGGAAISAANYRFLTN